MQLPVPNSRLECGRSFAVCRERPECPGVQRVRDPAEAQLPGFRTSSSSSATPPEGTELVRTRSRP